MRRDAARAVTYAAAGWLAAIGFTCRWLDRAINQALTDWGPR